MDDPGTKPDGGPIADPRPIEWWRPLDSGFLATPGLPGDPE